MKVENIEKSESLSLALGNQSGLTFKYEWDVEKPEIPAPVGKLSFMQIETLQRTHLVALKTRKRRAHLSTLTPSGGITSVRINITSIILHSTTKLSNRLNNETK